jgi:2,4-dienoyl-CoA reductase-like NADH-dependent reductase (Old Yellow Enzyme family)
LKLADELTLTRGPALKNRLLLAPLTNMQSEEDGTLGEDEYNWLMLRARGGFAMTMTCAAYVALAGKAFHGQLGISADAHLPGLERLARAIKAAGSVSAVQLQHTGLRANPVLSGEPPVAPWADEETGARAMTTGEVEQVIEDHAEAAVRAERAGFEGVEIHGAHGYLPCQFLDEVNNRRTDRFGGSFENRARIYFEMIEAIRARTGPDFQLGVRISPERYNYPLNEARLLAERLMASGLLDYLDMSLYRSFSLPAEEEHRHKPLIEHFMDIPRGNTRLAVVGGIMSSADAQRCLDLGADMVFVGRGAILHQDFARQAIADPDFRAVPLPVSREYLVHQGLGPAFVNYMETGWRNFVARDTEAA